jgi:hypothetical protein
LGLRDSNIFLGTYLISKPVIPYYMTQLVGDALTLPVLKATNNFDGMALIDSDPYGNGGNNWWTNQNNFYRQIRNFVIDMRNAPLGSGTGIHWQVAQATSLQNLYFNCSTDNSDSNKHQGIWMENGSGGFMCDLIFHGGNFGAWVGNQQFTFVMNFKSLYFNIVVYEMLRLKIVKLVYILTGIGCGS